MMRKRRDWYEASRRDPRRGETVAAERSFVGRVLELTAHDRRRGLFAVDVIGRPNTGVKLALHARERAERRRNRTNLHGNCGSNAGPFASVPSVKLYGRIT